MKKLLFVPLALALIAPLSVCATNLTDRAAAQTPTTSSDTLPAFTDLTKDWYRYKAKDGSYTALFPGQPKETVQSDSSVEVVYVDRANNRTYLIRNGKFGGQFNQNKIEEAFEAAVASLSEDGRIVNDQKRINRQGLPEREVTVQGTKGDLQGVVMKVRMFIDSQESAMYMTAVAAENVDFPEAQAFLDSVSIK